MRKTLSFSCAFVICVQLFLFSQPAQAQKLCSSVLSKYVENFDRNDRKDAFPIIAKFKNFFKGINERMLERSSLVDLAEVALLAEEHLLLMGPPGNAKSQLADLILGSISNADGSKSYYRIQMTPETTMSETHGPMDFKKLNDTGEYVRILKEGMLFSRNVFVDEIFDARLNAQRNILGFLAERSHAQGPHIVKGDIETVVGATNKYISEVYEKAGDDGPKAVLDRFAFITFVPATFENASSYVQLIQRAKKELAPITELRFDEIEKLRTLVKQVSISESVAKAVALLSTRMRAETEALELSSVKSYKDKIKNGEEPTIPYRATKFHSPRTLGKASAILKAYIVRDWINKNGKRKLEATIDDIAFLEQFFTLNGPSSEFVNAEIARTSNPHERAQLMTIIQEREIFKRNYEQIIQEMDAVSVKYALADLGTVIQTATTKREKEEAVQTIIRTLSKVVLESKENIKTTELDGSDIGRDYVQDYLRGLLKGLMNEREFQELDRVIIAKIREQKMEVIRAAEAERKRIADEATAAEEAVRRKAYLEQQQKEAAERRSKELKDKFSDASQFEVFSMETKSDPRNRNLLFAMDKESEVVVAYDNSADALLVTKLKGVATGTTLRYSNIQSVLGSEKSGNITQVYMADKDNVIAINETQQMAFIFNIEKNTLETVTLMAKQNISTTYSSHHKKMLTVDSAAMKLRFTSLNGAGESQSLRFVPSEEFSSVTEGHFKSVFNATNAKLLVSENGKYAVAIDEGANIVFKIDFTDKTVKAIFQTSTRANAQFDFDPRVLRLENSKVTVVEMSGNEPIVRTLTLDGYAHYNNGFGHIAGTDIVLMGDNVRSKGLIIYDGQAGTPIANGDPFSIAANWAGPIRMLTDDMFVVNFNNNQFNVKIIRIKKKAESK